jgi:uncharacterized protein
MIRVVFDTNVFVSALLQPLGPPSQLFVLAIAGITIQLCATGEIYAEYEEVIRRSKFKRTQTEIESALATVREKELWVRPSNKVFVCADPDDNIFLECAEAAQADYIVTGNLRDFPSEWAGTRIVTPRQMLDILSQGQQKFGKPESR